MLISKFDLYKPGWLELVFDDRNKEYGAYELRQHYARNMILSMCVAFLSIGTAAFIVGVAIKPVVTQIVKADPGIVVMLHTYHIKQPITPPRPITHVHQPPAASPVEHVNMQRLLPLVITTAPVAVEPPKTIDLKNNIGPVDIKSIGPATINPGNVNGPGTANAPGTGTGVVTDFTGLERMPEPIGGTAAWSRFLQKNLNYPDMAIDQQREGKVWVSFIVEKDGHLSDIVVEKGAGFGMDEEAIRVIKLAPAWKPGIQNGQPVRVRYDIPINFQLEK